MIKLDIQKTLYTTNGHVDLDIDIAIKKNEFVALSGVSGSGKTTLLRILAGLETAKGEIDVFGSKWLDLKKALPPQERGIGFVFQDYALFLNMTVLQNLLFVSKDAKLASHLLELTGLSELKERYPAMLSGGQRQRVSLCRALMKRPKILLMDEPLSALDPEMRTKLQHDILRLHKEFDTTTIMVSHDPSEMYRLATRVLVLEHGKIIKDGLAKDVLLKTSGSQKFTLQGELLEIKKADVIYIAIVAIGQQIVEIVLDSNEAKSFQPGQTVQVSTKAFSPSISAL
ncbi:ATP-binding cassette domain-containing protein [Sulfurimonas sp. HSL-1716]|uniref:ABC transporter ATP-binding protein n=1 Tax=Hydrocurvibacter sulfurireducens TaxID=3131937 RepID=UPI0031F93903